ncbi:hypothetical protein G0U57_018445, partial [Chelydra serpentina]
RDDAKWPEGVYYEGKSNGGVEEGKLTSSNLSLGFPTHPPARLISRASQPPKKNFGANFPEVMGLEAIPETAYMHFAE